MLERHKSERSDMMEKFIPYGKLSKKKKRELDLMRRGSWGALNPVTRKPKNPKAYDRRKAQNWKKDSGPAPFVYFRRLLRHLMLSSGPYPDTGCRFPPRRIQRCRRWCCRSLRSD